MSASLPALPPDAPDAPDPRRHHAVPASGPPPADTSEQDSFDVDLPASPYPGLRPFERHEWPIFFGRERMTDEVVERLVRQQFLVVHGDSGCGKSSLLRAGVLARLEQESARGGLTWRTCVTQPRDAPLQRLAAALAGLDGRAADEARLLEIRRVLTFGADAPSALARILRHGPADHVCVLIDQFEELFAFARGGGLDEARLFAQILVALLEQRPAGLYAVVTMRSEFLGACAQYRGLAEAVNRAQYLLPRMEHADLVRAIREPAALYGGAVSRALAERLIRDASGGQDQLPLIQHGLLLLYRRALVEAGIARADTGPLTPFAAPDVTPTLAPVEGWRLDLADYREPVAGLLSAHADRVAARATPTHDAASASALRGARTPSRAAGGADDPGDTSEASPSADAGARVVEHLFRALTDINAEGQAVRRPQTFARLLQVTGADEAMLRRVLDAFRAEGVSFITPFSHEPIHARTLVDISHEALIRCWGRIADRKAGWLAAEFQDGLVWRSLLVQADSFERNPSNILSPATAEERDRWLAERSSAWCERYDGGWERVTRLVRASLDAAQAAARAARTRTRRRFWWVAAAVVVVIAGVQLVRLQILRRTAETRANRTTASSVWERLNVANDPRIGSGWLPPLWVLGAANDDVKRMFRDELSRTPAHALRLGQRPGPVLRALRLRWPADEAATFREGIIEAMERKTTSEEEVVALASAAIAVPAPFTDTQVERLLLTLSRRAGRAGGRIAPALRYLPDRLSLAQSASAFQHLLPLLSRGEAAALQPGSRARGTTLDTWLERLALAVPAAQAGEVLTEVLEVLKHMPDRAPRGTRGAPVLAGAAGGLEPFGLAARALAAKVTPERAWAMLLPVLDDLRTSTPTQARDTRTMAVQVLGDRLAQDRAYEAFGMVLDATAAAAADKDGRALPVLGGGLRMLAARLSPGHARAAFDRVMASSASKPDWLATLAPVLDQLGPHASAERAPGAFATIAAAIGASSPALETRVRQSLAFASTAGDASARALASAAASLAVALPPSAAPAIWAAVTPAVGRTTDPEAIAHLAAIVAPVPPTGVPGRPQAALLAAVLKGMTATEDPAQLNRLVTLVPRLGAAVVEGEAFLALAPVLAGMRETSDSAQYQAYGAAVRLLADRLTPARAGQILPLVIEAAWRSTEPDERREYGGALRAIAGRLPPGRTQAALADVARSTGFDGGLDTLVARATVAEALQGSLNAAQVQAALEPAIAAATAPLDPRTLRASEIRDPASPSRALVSVAALVPPLASQLRPAQLDALLPELKRAIPALAGKEPGVVWAIASAASMFMSRLTDDERTQTFAALVTAIQWTERPVVLGAVARTFLARLSAERVHTVLRPALQMVTALTRARQLDVPEAPAAAEEPAPLPSIGELAALAVAAAPALTPDQARTLLDALLDPVQQVPDEFVIVQVTPAVGALIARVTAEDATKAEAAARAALAWAQDMRVTETAARLLLIVLTRNGTQRPDVTRLAEALTYPAVIGPASRVLLDALSTFAPVHAGIQAPGSAAGLDANLAWIADAYPAIDLRTIAACPHHPAFACPSVDR